MKRQNRRKRRLNENNINIGLGSFFFMIFGGIWVGIGILNRSYLCIFGGLVFVLAGAFGLLPLIAERIRRRCILSKGIERSGIIAAHGRDASLIIDGAPELVLTVLADAADGNEEEFTVHTGSSRKTDYPIGAEVLFIELDGRIEISDVFPMST